MTILPRLKLTQSKKNPSSACIGQGVSLETRYAAQAERRAANTAMAQASVLAAAAAERASSASPTCLSPTAEMDSIASPPTPASVDGPTLPSPVVWHLLSMLRILSKGGSVGAVAHWRGDDDVRVLASVRCFRRRGEDATINIRWEVGGGSATKGGFEVVAVRGGSRFRHPTVHCASADHCGNESGRWTARWEWAGGGGGGNDDGGGNVASQKAGSGAIATTMTARRRWWM